jgi:hypothetical protein
MGLLGFPKSFDVMAQFIVRFPAARIFDKGDGSLVKGGCDRRFDDALMLNALLKGEGTHSFTSVNSTEADAIAENAARASPSSHAQQPITPRLIGGGQHTFNEETPLLAVPGVGFLFWEIGV